MKVLLSKTFNSDSQLLFDMHIKTIVARVNLTIDLQKHFQWVLIRLSLAKIHKTFARSRLYYDDIIFDQALNNSFHQWTESVQHDTGLAIMNGIKRTSQERLYQKSGFEPLQFSRWLRKLFFFFVQNNKKGSAALFCYFIPKLSHAYCIHNFGTKSMKKSITVFSKTIISPRQLRNRIH